jgi:integral membrane sensor domain MASE1
MKAYLEKAFNFIFSGTAILLCVFAVLAYFLIAAGKSDLANQKRLEQQIAYCYKINAIMVDTDAGKFCVSPENLEVIK